MVLKLNGSKTLLLSEIRIVLLSSCLDQCGSSAIHV